MILISTEETLEIITASTEGPCHQRHTEGTHSLESREIILSVTSQSSRSPSGGYMTAVTTSLVTAPSVSEFPLIPGATSSIVPALLPSLTLISRLLPTSGASSQTATPHGVASCLPLLVDYRVPPSVRHAFCLVPHPRHLLHYSSHQVRYSS